MAAVCLPSLYLGDSGFLIYISRQSPRLTRLLGSNPVAVLDTLFLLSYTKLLRTVITALSLTTLQYPNNDSRIVWLYDPSVPIPKLIPFILVALIFWFCSCFRTLCFSSWVSGFGQRQSTVHYRAGGSTQGSNSD